MSARSRAGWPRARAPGRGRSARAKLEAAARLEDLADRCEKVARQIKRRVKGEPITDRIVSLSDADARPIRKDKLGKPNEFGGLSRRTAPPRGGRVCRRNAGTRTLDARAAPAVQRALPHGSSSNDRPTERLRRCSNAARSPWSIAGSAGRAEGVGAGAAANPAALETTLGS
jgi:hypothetical protein